MYAISYDRLEEAKKNKNLTEEETAFLMNVCALSPLSSISLSWQDHINLFMENYEIEKKIFQILEKRGNKVHINSNTWDWLTYFASSEPDAVINGVPTEIKIARHLYDEKFHFNGNTRWHGAKLVVVYNKEDRGIYWGFLKDSKDYFLEVKKLDEIR